MNHLDLFSGIGGFALAAKWAGFKTVAFVEIDEFCQKVLKKHWQGVPIYGDIKKIRWFVANRKIHGLEERMVARTQNNGQSSGINYELVRIETIDLLTGGFPCQPFSCAGKRGGTEDDRYLWPEMLRAIHEVKPKWILAENVPGLLTLQDGMVFERVCADLEAEGYEVLPLVIPACSQGAPHRRDRVWIVAHIKDSINGRDRGWNNGDQTRSKCSLQIAGSDRHAPDINGFDGDNAGLGSGEVSQFQEAEIQRCESTSDADRNGLQGSRTEQQTSRMRQFIQGGESWNEPWLEAATRLCRMDDGVSNRVDRLKSLGNAIVPQVAYYITKAIGEANAAHTNAM